MKNYFKKILIIIVALSMVIPVPLEAFAKENSPKVNTLELAQAKVGENETAEEYIKNPKQPDIYTLRSDYKVERDGDFVINYQPYVATVGAAASQEEQDKVKKNIKLPKFPGYYMPKDNGAFLDDFLIDYEKVVEEAKKGKISGDADYGIIYKNSRNFNYDAEKKGIKVKHVFQDLKDFDKYGNKPGEKEAIETIEEGKAGSKLKIKPLRAYEVKGFIPELSSIEIQVPLNTKNFTVEYRYNRNHYDVTFDTDGGTEVPSRTLYYGQVIPNVEQNDIPSKVGATFQGWKPSIDLKDESGKTFKAGEVIKDSSGNAIKDLKAKLTMPAENVKFTAVWKDNEKADYTIQFWTEKADYPKGASLLEKYDFVGTHVHKKQATGTRPDLANEPVKGVEFPDLEQARLQKIWNNDKFYRNYFLYLNKFYKYNKELTDERNADPKDYSIVKAVSSTGKTVYNIYYDRQVYDLYFTKSNAKTGAEADSTFYPEIWRHGKKLGEPGKPYHFKARFNQLMTEWPDDAQETKGFSDGKQSFGWSPNFLTPKWIYRDTPPYRLSTEDFLDMAAYNQQSGYTNEIDAGNGVKLKVNWDARPRTFTTLSFGIEQRGGPKEKTQPMPHHMDFWMDGFEPGETIIDYNLYRTKSDTESKSYGHKYPKVQGFTPYNRSEVSKQLDSDELAAMNEEREATTPFPKEKVIDPYGNEKTKGEMQFMNTFFNRADEFGDVADGSDAFEKNGYIRFQYHRNKYKLRFNNDPVKPKDDSEYNDTNQTDVFYQKPLKDLKLDNPQTLIDLGLTDLVEKDDEGNDRIKRPEGLAPQMVFKGWALDPAGQKLVWENKETMPAHNLVLYAKWDEPDYKWKVTFDPNGGKLDSISDKKVTTAPKTIKEGEIADQKEVTYPIKGENEGDKQVFTLVQRQKMVEPQEPTRKGYSFMGWEVLRYKKDANTGEYTEEVDTSYRDTYGVPELYSYGNDVVSPIYLKAIWVKNDMEDVRVYHHFLDNNLAIDKTIEENPAKITIENQRARRYVAAIASKQDANWILASDEDLKKSTDEETKKLYGDYQKLAEDLGNRATTANAYFQTILVEGKKQSEDGTLVDSPNNEFHFFYRPFRKRHYKVNYVDERAKVELAKATTDAEKKAIVDKYRILDQEAVTSLCRHYDARNYKPIIGWKLTSAPQQQLFYDVDENTHELKGINGTGSDEITFYYKDVRVIEVPKDGKTPDGYIRVKFKADKGGSFGNDKNGKPIKELNYDVLKGIKSDLLPVPMEWKDGETNDDGTPKQKDKDKYYITPYNGKIFTKWDDIPLLNSDTVIEKPYVFTAKFAWSDLSAKGLVTTESYNDPDNKWTNKFAPTIDNLKDCVEWREKGDLKPSLPAGSTLNLLNDSANELTDNDIYDKVKEKNASDKDELVRKESIKAIVKFEGNDDVKWPEVDIPIKVYKNRYEALTSGEMPKFLKDATTKPDGDLVELLKDTKAKGYVKVTVNPTGKPGDKDSKVYYVNPNAWVEIPEIKIADDEKTSLGFIHWTSDKEAQNEDGIYDFAKRHKFTEDTVITPKFVKDVVPQDGEDKPKDVPDKFVKVIVKTTDKATEKSAFEKIYWVNPTKKVVIPAKDKEPIGGEVKDENGEPFKNAAGEIQQWQFKEWQVSVIDGVEIDKDKAKTWSKGSDISDQFTKETTIVAKYNLKLTPIVPVPEIPTISEISVFESIKDDSNTFVNDFMPKEADYDTALSEVKKLEGYKEYKILDKDEDIYKKVMEEDANIVGDSKPRTVNVKAEVTFANGIKQTVNIPVKVYKNVYRALNNEEKPDVVKNTEKLKGFVKVTVNPTKLAKDQTKKVYYVNPNAKVIIPENDPTPIENHKFVGWYKGKEKIDLKVRHNISMDTEIIASYTTPGTPVVPLKPTTKLITKNIGDSLTVDDYEKAITPPKEGDKELRKISAIKIVADEKDRVNTKNAGDYKEKIKVIYEDGATYTVDVDVKVLPDYIKQDGKDKPKDVPDKFVKVIFNPTDKATDEAKTIYWVNPTKEVKLPVENPQGKTAVVVNNVSTDYVFKEWKNSDNDEPFNVKDAHQFTQTMTFEAKYKEVIAATPIKPIPDIKSEGLIVGESLKDGDKWINKFIPTEKELKDAIKIKADDDSLKGLPEGATVQFGNGDIGSWKTYDNLEDVLYDKLKEKNGDKPSREEKIKALITVDGWSRIVEIPITVNKNIYEAKTNQGAPNYVPKGYVKVELDPTRDAQDSQKTYYYVNPEAKVKIPGSDPKPVDGKVFAGWALKAGDKDEVSYDLAKRHQFTDESNVIKATFVSDVVEQKGDDKPNVPDTFIKVIVDTTDKATDATKFKKTFWVNPKAKVKLTVENPVGKSDDTKKITWKFKDWQIDKADGKKYNTDIIDTFSEEVTIKANYFVEAKPLLTPVKTIKEKVIPIDGEISAKDFVKNLYNDDDPNNKGNLPAGMKFRFVDPVDTSKVGEKPAKIEVEYPNGEKTTIDVKVIVVEDKVEQEKSKNKPQVPDSYVKVVVDYTDKAKLETGAEKVRTFWVNPDKKVKILDSNPEAIENWKFEKWMVGKEDISLTEGNRFKEPVTNVKAQYSYKPVEIQPLEPNPDTVQTYVGKKPEKDDYIKKLNPPEGKTIKDIEILEEPDVNKPGETKAKIKVKYDDGSEVGTPEDPVIVNVEVKDNIYPGDTNGNKTSDIPENYVKVIVDPTSNAKDAQKKYYYVNPKTNVKLALTNPEAIEHYNFVGWAIGDTGFEADKDHKFTQETTITAKYYQDPIVTFLQVFSDNSVKKTDKMFVKKGDKLNEADLPTVGTKDGDWVFKGWFANDKLTEKFDFETIIEKNTTIYGVWNKIPTMRLKDTTIVKGTKFDLNSLVVKAEDLEDKDLKDKVTIVSDGGFDNNKVGKYEIKFRVEDKDGATYEDTATVTVIEGCNPSNVIVGRNTCEFVSGTRGNGNRQSSPYTGDNMSHIYTYMFGLSLASIIAYLSRKNKKSK